MTFTSVSYPIAYGVPSRRFYVSNLNKGHIHDLILHSLPVGLVIRLCPQ